MNKIFLGLAAALGLGGGMAGAQASPITGTGTFQFWSGDTIGQQSNSGAAAQQALPGAYTNFAQNGNHANNYGTGSGTWNGSINFTDTSANTVAGFLAASTPSFGGIVTSHNTLGAGATLSSGNYAHTTLFEITFTIASASLLSFTHDDGVSLFANGNISTNLLPASAAAPTKNATVTVTVGPGSYDLYYTEANGLPANLLTNVTALAVPEPVSLALLGSGLAAVGLVRRRHRSKT